MIEGSVVVTPSGKVGTIISENGGTIMVLLSDGFIWQGSKHEVYKEQDPVSEDQEGTSQ